MKSSEKDNSYGHILKYAGVFGGVQGLNILVGLIRNKLVALLLGPSGMGLMSIFNSTTRLLSDTTNMGIMTTGTREVAEAYSEDDPGKLEMKLAAVRSWSLLTAMLGMVVCALLSPLLNQWTFPEENYTYYFILLSPVVGLTAITGGEISILKGTHRLRSLAVISVYGVIASLVISVPLFYIWGEVAIVPSLILVALVQMCITIVYSFKLYPFRRSLTLSAIASGKGMLRLGIAFMLAGMFGSGAEFVIRAFMNTEADTVTVGLYNAGYMIAMVYAGTVFSAMETDYYPRLSSISGVGEELYCTVLRQMEIMLLLAAPLLAMMMVAAPLLLPLLFSSEFQPVLGMLRLLLLAMYFRAIMLPVEYINLARGNARGFLFLEIIFNVMTTAGVILGFHFCGLLGAGISWIVVYATNALIVFSYAWRVYRFRMSAAFMRMAFTQFTAGLSVYISSSLFSGVLSWLVGGVFAIVSILISLYYLRGRMSFKQLLHSIIRKHHDD